MFAAVPKPRHGRLGVVFVVVVFFIASRGSYGSALTSALLSGGAVGAAMLIVQLPRPRPVVVAATERTWFVVEMSKLRARRAVRLRTTLSRADTPLRAVPSRTPGRQELALGNETYVAGGASADVVRRLASAPPTGHVDDSR